MVSPEGATWIFFNLARPVLSWFLGAAWIVGTGWLVVLDDLLELRRPVVGNTLHLHVWVLVHEWMNHVHLVFWVWIHYVWGWAIVLLILVWNQERTSFLVVLWRDVAKSLANALLMSEVQWSWRVHSSWTLTVPSWAHNHWVNAMIVINVVQLGWWLHWRLVVSSLVRNACQSLLTALIALMATWRFEAWLWCIWRSEEGLGLSSILGSYHASHLMLVKAFVIAAFAWLTASFVAGMWNENWWHCSWSLLSVLIEEIVHLMMVVIVNMNVSLWFLFSSWTTAWAVFAVALCQLLEYHSFRLIDTWHGEKVNLFFLHYLLNSFLSRKCKFDFFLFLHFR